MFAIAGFSDQTIMDPQASPKALQEMAEGIADIFLNGVNHNTVIRWVKKTAPRVSGAKHRYTRCAKRFRNS